MAPVPNRDCVFLPVVHNGRNRQLASFRFAGGLRYAVLSGTCPDKNGCMPGFFSVSRNKKYILSLRIYIRRLRIYILRLRIYILSLRIQFLCRPGRLFRTRPGTCFAAYQEIRRMRLPRAVPPGKTNSAGASTCAGSKPPKRLVAGAEVIRRLPRLPGC